MKGSPLLCGLFSTFFSLPPEALLFYLILWELGKGGGREGRRDLIEGLAPGEGGGGGGRRCV